MVGSIARGTRAAWPVFLLVAAAVGPDLLGCGFFDIRDPVSPVAGRTPPRRQPIDPDSVLFNFTYSVRFKLDGMAQYEESLAESFSFVLDVVDAQELPSGIDSLDRGQAVDAQRRLAGEFPDSFYFAFEEKIPERQDVFAFYEDIGYELQFLSRQGDTLLVTQVSRGTADITMRENENQVWAMTRWQDQRPEGDFESYGKLLGSRALVTSAPSRKVVE